MSHRGMGNDDDNEEYKQVTGFYEEAKEEDRGCGSGRKRRRSGFIDDDAEELDKEEDVEGNFNGRGGRRRRQYKKVSASKFFDEEAAVNSNEEEEEEDGEEDFIVEGGSNLPDEDDGRRMLSNRMLPHHQEEYEDLEAVARSIQERYGRHQMDYDEEMTGVEQQALLPSVRDSKLWMVKCAIGHEREIAVCLMQKCRDKGSQLQIRSTIALDHLKNYIYVEADKETHVREACKGLRNISCQKIMLVPIREMTNVLSVESKAIDLARDTWIRMKIGTYKGDLAKGGREVMKKAFVPPPRLMNVDEARELHIPVEHRRDAYGERFDVIGGMMFKDGFLYKTVSTKSMSVQNIKPTFDELEKFHKLGKSGDDAAGSLSALFANRKKEHFMKGDAVIVIKGELKNLKGCVEKVDEGNVHIRPEIKGLPKTLLVNEKELCKYFEPGNHVKVVSGAQEGATGMVVKVEQHVLIIISDATKEHIHVFADDAVKCSEVTTGVTRIGDYELHDLVLLDNTSFGVIIHIESEALQVLKGIPDRSEIVLVKLREIKCKIQKKITVLDRFKNMVSSKDVVRIVDGPFKGKQGTVEHIYRGILFIFDCHALEQTCFLCAKGQSCVVVGGSHSSDDRNGDAYSRFSSLRSSSSILPSTGRFSRGEQMGSGGQHRGRTGHDCLAGTTVKVRQGPYKGFRGRVIYVKGSSVRVELESQMKVVTVDRNHILDNAAVTRYCDTSRYGMGCETPMHPSRTPFNPYMTPMRDPGATPIHYGMRTPMRDRAWNPCSPISRPRMALTK